NLSEKPQQVRLGVDGLEGIKLVTDTPVVTIGPTGNEVITVHAQVDPEAATSGSHPIHFTATSVDGGSISLSEKSSFI
ncbi:MAG: FixG Ig-like domain-containing protein, partial [Microvirgula sp.]